MQKISNPKNIKKWSKTEKPRKRGSNFHLSSKATLQKNINLKTFKPPTISL